MRRIVIVGVVVGAGVLVVRRHLPKLHQLMLTRCEEMFERMPDTFPPKRMMRGIEEIRGLTTRILEEQIAARSDASEVRDAA